MRTLAVVSLMMIVSGCVGAGQVPVESRPLCDRTADLRIEHAVALAEDGARASMSTGRALIATIDAYCLDA